MWSEEEPPTPAPATRCRTGRTTTIHDEVDAFLGRMTPKYGDVRRDPSVVGNPKTKDQQQRNILSKEDPEEGDNIRSSNIQYAQRASKFLTDIGADDTDEERRDSNSSWSQARATSNTNIVDIRDDIVLDVDVDDDDDYDTTADQFQGEYNSEAVTNRIQSIRTENFLSAKKESKYKNKDQGVDIHESVVHEKKGGNKKASSRRKLAPSPELVVLKKPVLSRKGQLRKRRKPVDPKEEKVVQQDPKVRRGTDPVVEEELLSSSHPSSKTANALPPGGRPSSRASRTASMMLPVTSGTRAAVAPTVHTSTTEDDEGSHQQRSVANSSVVSISSLSHTSHRPNIQPMRWTEQDTDNLLMQLEFFGNADEEFHRLLSKSAAGGNTASNSDDAHQKLMDCIHSIVEKKNHLQRDDPILQRLSKALHALRLVDLDRVLEMLQEQHKIGDMMETKDVLLLVGPQGSGKTTTLQYMAGTTLEEVEEQGFFHLKPVHFQNKELRGFETSCYKKRTTRNIQATSIHFGATTTEQEIVLCDTPGLGVFDSVEEEICTGLGMIRELQRAKSVHPLVVLSKEALGSRCGNMKHIVHDLRNVFALESCLDVKALNYVFSKYEAKQRGKICRQFAALESASQNVTEEDRTIFQAIVKDIINKTTPKANVVLPMEGNHVQYVEDLWNAVKDSDGKGLLTTFASTTAMEKLKLQLQLTMYDFTNLLAKCDYKLAVHRLLQLQDLARILPIAQEYATKTQQIGARHIILVSDMACESVEAKDFASAVYHINEIEELDKVIPSAKSSRERILKKLRKQLKQMVNDEPIHCCLDRLVNLGKLRKLQPQTKEYLQCGFETILKDILRSMEEQDFDTTLHNLEALSTVAKQLPEAGECAWRVLKAMKELVYGLTQVSEFENLFNFMLQLSKIAMVFPDATDCIRIGFESLKEKSMDLFEAKNYARFVARIRQLGKLTESLPFDHPSLNRKDKLLMDTIGDIVDKKDFASAVNVVKNLQNLDAVVADSRECIEGGFHSLLRRAVSSINDVDYVRAVGMMEEVSKLLPALPSDTDSIQQALRLLVPNVRSIAETLEIEKAREFLLQLHELTKVLPEVQDGVNSGFEVLLVRAINMLGKAETHKEGLKQLLDLISRVRPQRISSESVQRGLQELDQAVEKSVETMNLESGVDLVHRLNKVIDVHGEVSKSVNTGFEKLILKAAQPMTSNDFSLAVAQLEAIGNIKHKFILADDCIERGIKEVNLKMKKSLEFAEFQDAIGVLHMFYKLSRTFSETSKTLSLGFEILLEKAVDNFDHKKYRQSMSELNLLGPVFQQFSLPEEVIKGNLACLVSLIPDAIDAVTFDEGVAMLQSLVEVSLRMPGAVECVHVAFESLLKESVHALSGDKWNEVFIPQMQQINMAMEGVPDSAASSRRGLQELGGEINNIIDGSNIDVTVQIVQDLHKLSVLHPSVCQVVQDCLRTLLERTASAFERDGFVEGINHLQKLGKLHKLLDMQDDSVKDSKRRVLKHLVTTVRTNIEILSFSMALKFLTDLNEIRETYPEAVEAVQAGFEAFLQRAAKNLEEHRSLIAAEQLIQAGELQRKLRIEKQSYKSLTGTVPVIQHIFETSTVSQTTEMIKSLAKLSDLYPEFSECVDRGLYLLWKVFEDAFGEQRYNAAAEILKSVGAYQMASPVADRILRKGMKRMKKVASNDGDDELAHHVSKLMLQVSEALSKQDGTYQNECKKLRQSIEGKLQDDDYHSAANLLQKLVVDMAERTPEAAEFAKDGFQLIVQAIDAALENQDMLKIATILRQFAKLESIPEASLCLEYATSVLKSLTEKSIAKHDLGGVMALIENLHASPMKSQRIQSVKVHAVSCLGKAMEKPPPQGKHNEVVHVIQQLSHSSVTKAGDCARRGLKGLWISVKYSIEKHDYAVAISLMRQMKDLSVDLPEAGDCVQLAFVALRVRLVQTIDKQNYDATMELVGQLIASGEDLPGTLECIQFGFEALQEKLKKAIEGKNYNTVIQQLKCLIEIENDFSGVATMLEIGFASIAEAVAQEIKQGGFDKALDLMLLLAGLSEQNSNAMDCTRKGLLDLWSAFEGFVEKGDYHESVEVLLCLGKLAASLKKAEDGVQLGFEMLQEKFDKMLESKDHDAAVALMQDLSKLAYDLPEACSCVQNGFEILRERLVKIIELQDYSTARKLIGRLEQELSSTTLQQPLSVLATGHCSKDPSDDCTLSESFGTTNDRQERVDLLSEQLQSTIDDNDFSGTMEAMISLSNMEHVISIAGEVLENGQATLKLKLNNLLKKIDSKTILSLLVTFHKETHRLPAFGELVEYGMQETEKAAEKNIEEKEYDSAIELLQLLCNLMQDIPDAFAFAQNALNGACQHMAILREETTVSIEELGDVKDSSLFSQLLDTASDNLDAVIATDELRSFCAQLNKKNLGSESNPIYLDCELRLASSTVYCKEQVQRAATNVASGIPDLMAESAFIEVFAGNGEDNLLSVLECLALLKEEFSNYPGSSSINAIYAEVFDKFTSFLDGVVSLAQTEFTPKMNLKTFETQVLMVTYLIDGYLDFAGTISDADQRKIEDIEHRQARLMLRFEIEVADALEIISNNRFPSFEKNDDRDNIFSYIRTMRVSQLQKHREILAACANSRELTAMISDNIDVSAADSAIAEFDKELDTFLEHLISLLEDEKERIDSLPKTQGGAPAMATDQVASFLKSVQKVTAEAVQISTWPTDVYGMNASYYLSRLRALENYGEFMTKKIEEGEGYSFGSFLSSFGRLSGALGFTGFKVPDHYNCVVGTKASEEATS